MHSETWRWQRWKRLPVRSASGMLADILIWNQDLMRLPVEQVSRAQVGATIYDGKVVYQRH
jgi:predicted amidohydrolase YtcJ